MQALLAIAGKIDWLNERLARLARWALLADALLIAGNALSRKLFSITAPVIFDLQWHFFAAVVLLMAAYTFQRDEHVRIDIFAQRLGERGLAWLDFIGIVLFLLPVCGALIWVAWPQFTASFLAGETRATRESLSDLPAWIIKGFIPLGFGLLALQGIAEAIRCVASLRGIAPRRARRGKLFEDALRGG
jgi:TRAP-type mannitol/chloroaromatic compound transport system permease small subunit